MSKVIGAEEAAALIEDGSTVVVGGTGPILVPNLILETLERRFLDDGHPRNLTAPPTPELEAVLFTISWRLSSLRS